MKIVLIKNVVFGGERKVAGDIVDVEDEIAKEFLKADLAAVYGEIENGEVVVDADPEVLEEAEAEEAAPKQAEESEAEAEEKAEAEEAAPKQEAPKAKQTAKKTGGKAKK